MPILVKGDDVRSGIKVNVPYSQLWPAQEPKVLSKKKTLFESIV